MAEAIPLPTSEHAGLLQQLRDSFSEGVEIQKDSDKKTEEKQILISDNTKRAAQIAELNDFITYYPTQKLDWRQQLIESFSSGLKLLIPEVIRENLILKESINSLKEIDRFNDPKGLYVRCENCLI